MIITGKANRLMIAAVAVTMVTATAVAGDRVRGTVEVIDGATMTVDGTTVRLADIVVPQLGDECVWRGRTFDCGKLAKAGLMDVTAGAQVVCTATGAGAYRCDANGYDLGFGMIHAGWAVPVAGAPSHYHARMVEAREHKRMLWSATDRNGKPEYARSLTR